VPECSAATWWFLWRLLYVKAPYRLSIPLALSAPGGLSLLGLLWMLVAQLAG